MYGFTRFTEGRAIRLAAVALIVALLFTALSPGSVATPVLAVEDTSGADRAGVPGSGMGANTAASYLMAVSADEASDAILNASGTSCFDGSISFDHGATEQFAVHTSGAGFPTDGSSYLLISSGNANPVVPATAAGLFLSVTQGSSEGVLAVTAGGAPTGHATFDRATVTLSFFVPAHVSAVSFDWKFGSEEPPTFYKAVFQDYFTAVLAGTSVASSTWVDDNIDVLGANLPGGSSAAPTPPFPTPDDTAYNSTTPGVQTTTVSVAAYAGGTVTLQFHVADASDMNLDSGVFLDNLGFDVLCVDIDIKPGGDPNPINTKSKGTIPVAILSSPDFDAATVDPASLTFGKTGNEASLDKCTGLEDVNGDGLLDLVCHFFTELTGFTSGDTVGILKGQTFGGESFAGSDSVKIVK